MVIKSTENIDEEPQYYPEELRQFGAPKEYSTHPVAVYRRKQYHNKESNRRVTVLKAQHRYWAKPTVKKQRADHQREYRKRPEVVAMYKARREEIKYDNTFAVI